MCTDLRFACRQLLKSPGFTAVAVLTLALGIGANTAIFSVVNSVLLRPLPYPEADRLVQIWERTPDRAPMFGSGLAFKHWQDDSTHFAGMAATEPTARTLSGGRSPERVTGLRVSASYLRVLRIAPLLGHDFAAGADRWGGGNNVVILSHALWQGRFGGDPAIVGRTIVMDQTPTEVIGVLPPAALLRNDALFLVPLLLDDPLAPYRMNPSTPWTTVVARLRPGVSPEVAEAGLAAIRQAHAAEYPTERQDWSVSVVPMRQQLTGAAEPVLMILCGTGLLVLLIACANVANLLLARASARQREMAVRVALGASQAQVMRTVLTESLLIAVAGAALAVAVASFSIELLGRITEVTEFTRSSLASALQDKLTGGALPVILEPEIDWTVLVFSLVTASGTGVLAGLLPAWRASRADPNRDLKDAVRSSGSRARTRAQSLLVTAEVALTVLLLTGTGLFTRSFARLVSVDPGFSSHNVLAIDLVLSRAGFPENDQLIRFEQAIVRRLREVAGIDSAATATTVPFRGIAWGGAVGLAEQPDRRLDVMAGVDYIVGDYFGVLGIPLLRGRDFTEQDHSLSAPRVVVVNEALVRLLFSRGENPIGRRVILARVDWEIVGVVANVRFNNLAHEPRPAIYRSHVYDPWTASLLVRSPLPVPELLSLVARTVQQIDPEQPIEGRLISVEIGRSVSGRKVMLALVAAFAGIALVLACLGIYGVLAYSIGQRQRELGIRLALGAPRPGVMAMVVREGMRPAVIGLGAGLAAALAGARLVGSLLFGISAYDPLVFAVVPSALAAAALLSCWLPARRAMQMNPLDALRAE